MALVPATRSRIPVEDPTASLKEALDRFESILTDKQKRAYNLSAAVPDASSVIVFVKQVDDENVSKTRRCVAPRLCHFLDSIQRFTSIIDTFVSSNPRIAALLWGGIRLTIMSANNAASYFDKVTSMLMSVGRSCPTYQDFGDLYPNHVGLQRALCEYYATTVRLCIKIVEVSRRSFVTQTISSIAIPFEADFRDTLHQLDQNARQIQLQTSHASKQADREFQQLVQNEHKDNNSHRLRSLKFYEKVGKDHADAQQRRLWKAKIEASKLRSSIRNNLSTVRHTKPWNQAMKERAARTAEWLLTEPAFDQWKRDNNTTVFWCSGNMGVGKTVLISNLIAHLSATIQPDERLSYFLCCNDNEASLSARNILGSLTSQLLDIYIEHANRDVLQRLYEDSCDLDTFEVTDLLLSCLDADKTYYLLIDGLDECTDVAIRDVLSALTRICQRWSKKCKILCSGRPELAQRLSGPIEPKHKVLVSPSKVHSDMDCYIEAILCRCLEDESLKLSDPRLIAEIEDTLRRDSKGMFLWTRLFVDELCAQNSDSDILCVLKNVPSGLSELFSRKLHRIKSRTTAHSILRVLRFCGAVKRPLSSDELREALSLNPGQKSLDRSKLPNDMNVLISGCCGLVYVDEEDDSVHYVHHSVKQYLFDCDESLASEFKAKEVDEELGLLSMTYLDFADFKLQLAKIKSDRGRSFAPLQLGMLPTTQSQNGSNSLALWYLKNRRRTKQITAREFEDKTQEALGIDSLTQLELHLSGRGYKFLHYAKTYWIFHLSHFDIHFDSDVWQLFCRCVQGDVVTAHRPWTPDQQIDHGSALLTGMLQWSMDQRNCSLLSYLTKYHSDILTESVRLRSFEQAAIGASLSLTKAILNAGETTPAMLDKVLYYNAREAYTAAIPHILKLGANIDAFILINRRYRLTALQVAAERGHPEMVQVLLANGADVNINSISGYVRTALQLAMVGGHLQVVDCLIMAGADVNDRDGASNQTPLQTAIQLGNLRMVERLLNADARLDVYDHKTIEVLEAAAQKDELTVVDKVLTGESNVSDSTSLDVLLRAASASGCPRMLKILIVMGADVNSTPLPAILTGPDRPIVLTNDFVSLCTALYAAVRHGSIEIVETLLAAGAEVNLPGNRDSYTALGCAALSGNVNILQSLFDAGADVNARSGCYTALELAAASGNVEIVDRLLAMKADVNTDYPGFTPLMLAAARGLATPMEGDNSIPIKYNLPHLWPFNGYNQMVKKLIAAGAHINAFRSFALTPPPLRTGTPHSVTPKDEQSAENITWTALDLAVGANTHQTNILSSRGIYYDHVMMTGFTHHDPAAAHVSPQIVSVLLDAGARAECAGQALCWAARWGCLETVKMLLAAGVSHNYELGGRTPLVLALENGDEAIFDTFIAAGADVTRALNLVSGQYHFVNDAYNQQMEFKEAIVERLTKLSIRQGKVPPNEYIKER